jgi:hypothetical protein
LQPAVEGSEREVRGTDLVRQPQGRSEVNRVESPQSIDLAEISSAAGYGREHMHPEQCFPILVEPAHPLGMMSRFRSALA